MCYYLLGNTAFLLWWLHFKELKENGLKKNRNFLVIYDIEVSQRVYLPDTGVLKVCPRHDTAIKIALVI